MADIIPFRFIVTTDLHSHVYPPGAGTTNIYQYFQDACDEIIRVFGDAGDFMITTGDQSDVWPNVSPTSGTSPEVFRNAIDSKFGEDFRWVNVVGNHDIDDKSGGIIGGGIQWIRDEWEGNNPSSQLRARKDYAYAGPDGCSTTQYYFFNKGIMFIIMNWYWDGENTATSDRDGYSSTYNGGRIIDEQIDWLRDLFSNYQGYRKMIFGHGNAFAFSSRHSDRSGLGGANKNNRDIFWNLLEENNVLAYIYGHTHERRIDYVDNTYWNGGSVEDSWSYGASKIPHICAGQIEPKWPGDFRDYGSFPTFLNVSVTDTEVIFDIYEALEVTNIPPTPGASTATPGWEVIKTTTVPLRDDDGKRGGVWYYSQDKFGSEWFNKVNNNNGWSVDFNLRVVDVQNSESISMENKKGKGVGVYVNDGAFQEIINFLPQEIVFSNANQSVIYDTTTENDYRITGKKNNLKLYSRKSGEENFSEISNVNFRTLATSNGNAFNPHVCEDSNGDLHAVWWDDGRGNGVIFYSKLEGGIWSDPAKIVELDNGVQFPNISVDDNGLVYVAFESKQTDGSVIGVVFKNDMGWSKPYYTGQDIGLCQFPKLSLDNNNNVCVVWEDNRNGISDIYIDILMKETLEWRGEVKLSNNIYGSKRPSITSYIDDIFISWTKINDDGTSVIEVIKFNSVNYSLSSIAVISRSDGYSDYSDIIVNSSGRIISAWHDQTAGVYNIYSTVITPKFDAIISASELTNGNGGARYPVLSEQLSTGHIYISWQDFKDVVHDGFSAQDIRPSNSAISVAYYDGSSFVSSANSSNGGSDFLITTEEGINAYFPSSPIAFRGELPIVYETYVGINGDHALVSSSDFLLKLKSVSYDLLGNVSATNLGRPINKNYSTKEIRFGDFSDVLNVHYVFKELKYYLKDAVEPYNIKNIDANTTNIDSLSAYDAEVNNYGDAWIVGPCGTYCFINRYNRLIKVGPGEAIIGAKNVSDQNAEKEKLKKFRVIEFDNFNNMYMGGENGLFRYSSDHFGGFYEKEIGISNTITAIVFDKDNSMYVGTDSGLHKYENVVISKDKATVANGVVSVSMDYSKYVAVESDMKVSCLKVDDNNCVWIGSKDGGIYRYYKGNLINFTVSHGLYSNIINDIAIRNTAIRYIATAKGISKMVGFNFDEHLSSKDDVIWNNNVKSIEWKDPNVLLAGTMSRTNQIIINDDDNTYSTVFYEPGFSFNKSVDDFSVYFITETDNIVDGDVLEVYINGNRILFGYDVSSDNKVVRFKYPISNYDVVEVMVRKDLEKVYSFERSKNEISSIGNKVVKISSLEYFGNNLYSVSTGEENEVKINDSNSILPFDKVHLDTIPPRFDTDSDGIKIGSQIDGSVVEVTISGATDSTESIVGSGIEGMIISNYSNFTTDGSTPQSYVPFSTSVHHDLGNSLNHIVRELTFDSGSGSVIYYVSDSTNEIYAATSKPAVVYKYNWSTEAWSSLISYGEDQYVDFIFKHNNNVLISVGHDTDVSKIYVYNYSSTGLTLYSVLSATESRSYCYHVLNGKLYIGAGGGSGDEYSSGAGGTGAVYIFDDGSISGEDPYLTLVIDGIDENVYALTSISGSNNLIAATGPEGYIYEINVSTPASLIVYNSPDALVSLVSHAVNSKAMVFAGGETNGVIRKTLLGNNTYDVTFRTTPSKVSSMKVFKVVDPLDTTQDYLTVYASVGTTIYYLSEAGTWTWKYTHHEDINDMTLNNNTNSLYVISDSGITRINPLVESKTIYLKLIDRAGNESVLDPIPLTEAEVDATPWVDYINISSLKDFINENKVFEIDELGNAVDIPITGDSKFYSGEKIEIEKGEYASEIFDGSNDLVKWETISWEAQEMENTSVSVYIRSSTSQNDILIAEWLGPFDNSRKSGVNIGSMIGQFIQFKIVLTSSVKNISPSFYRASIRAVTGESVHFFTTNFTAPTRINKGIITSEKVIPVSADIVFGINTTNSIDWTEYQLVDENRIFNVNQTGHNLRVGIKFISPNRSLAETVSYSEYGPYNSNLYVNTIDFDFENDSGLTHSYNFQVTLYRDYSLTDPVFSAYSADSSDGFSIDGAAIPEGGVSLSHNETSNVLFSVPGFANIVCNTYYYVKIEYIYDTDFEVFSNDTSFVASCTSSFIDSIDFDFENNEVYSNYYHFRIKFYSDLERTNEYLTVFSGNNRSGWMADSVQIPEDGVLVSSGGSVNILYRPVSTDFDIGTIYYLTIEAHNGSEYVFASNSYTFQVRDVQGTEYCGGYDDVPIVKNFSIMFELDNNEFITLNI